MSDNQPGEHPKQAEVPRQFCNSKCCAWRGDNCLAIMTGTGVCLWTHADIDLARKQGIIKEKRG